MTDINSVSQNTNVITRAMTGNHGETWLLRLGPMKPLLLQYITMALPQAMNIS